jgi:N-acetylglutamate synthase-like GNAT family acetyltransferase
VVVAEVERLAEKRGFTSVFAHTLSPCFFEAVGYAVVDRGCFPEKRARPHTTCVERALTTERRRRLRVAA